MQPQSKEAEQSLLGSLIADPKMFHVISGLVTDQSFYTTKHQYVFAAITKLVKDDLPVDIISLGEILQGRVSRSELLSLTSPTGANAASGTAPLIGSISRHSAHGLAGWSGRSSVPSSFMSFRSRPTSIFSGRSVV